MRATVSPTLASLSILLLSSPVPAQRVTASALAQYSLPVHSAACPVDLDVRHEAGLHALVPAQSNNPQKEPTVGDSMILNVPPQQSLALDVRNVGNKKIASLDLLIQTESISSHATPLLLRSGDTFPSESAEQFTLHLGRSIGAQNQSRFAYSLPSLHAIAFIELHKVIYEDGSYWLTPSESSCRFKLNPLMLVASGVTNP